MLTKPQFETYRYTGEIDRLHSQSIVECRLSGSEIGSILTVQASAIPTECVCADGEVRYGGKLLLCVVYEDGDRKICRAERGAEFFHKAEGDSVTSACFAKVAFRAENVTHRREGSGLYISVVVGACVNVYGGKQIEYLTGGEHIAVLPEPMGVCKTVCVSGEAEGEEELETDYVGDILLHSENAVVTRVSAADGLLRVEGEMALGVCVLKGDDSVCSYERLLPFTLEIPCDEAYGDTRASARVCVKSARLTAGVDEEKGKSKILFSYLLAADCFLSQKEEITVAKDAFSPVVQVQLREEKGEGRYLTSTVKCTERIDGVAALSSLPEGEYALEAAMTPTAEITCKRTDGGVEAEGAVLAQVLMRGADGSRKCCTLSLPFLFPVEIAGEYFEVDAIVCGLNVRRKNGGETQAEATVKACVKGYTGSSWAYIADLAEGEAIAEKDSAVSIFVPRAGETLWEVAKRLGRTPTDLQQSNPDLVFPVQEGERIFVYRQLR